jgi:hypothetical protein
LNSSGSGRFFWILELPWGLLPDRFCFAHPDENHHGKHFRSY